MSNKNEAKKLREMAKEMLRVADDMENRKDAYEYNDTDIKEDSTLDNAEYSTEEIEDTDINNDCTEDNIEDVPEECEKSKLHKFIDVLNFIGRAILLIVMLAFAVMSAIAAIEIISNPMISERTKLAKAAQYEEIDGYASCRVIAYATNVLEKAGAHDIRFEGSTSEPVYDGEKAKLVIHAKYDFFGEKDCDIDFEVYSMRAQAGEK